MILKNTQARIRCGWIEGVGAVFRSITPLGSCSVEGLAGRLLLRLALAVNARYLRNVLFRRRLGSYVADCA